MGNSESHYKGDYTSEQLRQSEKTDLQLLSLFSEKEFLNESYIRQKYVHDVESNRHQYDIDVDKSAKRKKYVGTLTNLQCALSSILEDSGNFRMKQMRTIEKELSNFSSLGPTSFDSLFDIKLQFYQKVHSALLRREKRMAANPPPNVSPKAVVIFIKSLYGNPSEDPKVLEHILKRIHELPNLNSMLFVPDQVPAIPEEENLSVEDQMEVENEPYKESLIDYLLKVVFEEFVSFKQEISASLQLLIYIQRDIILNVSIQNPTTISIQRFLDYTNKIILFTLDLFSVNRIELMHDLSVLYLLIMPFLPCLYLLLNRSILFNVNTINTILPNLLKLLLQLDKLIANSDDDKNYLNNLQNSIKLQSPVEIESSHNYAPNIDEEITINMNGATHICVTFDPRCNTEAGNDFLQLYRFPNKIDPLLPAFSGRSENWPKIPFIFPGDEVTFHFHSSPFGSHWGYKCMITGLVLESNRKSRLYDVSHTFAMLVRKCLLKLIMGNVSEEENQVSSIIESPLLRGGITQSPTESKENIFIEDFIYNKEGTNANSIIRHIEKLLPPNPTVDRLGAKELGDCLRSFIIANIKHYGILESVLNVNSTKELTQNIEKQLIQIWLEARKLRQYIASERRRILLERESENNNSADATNTEFQQIDTSSYEYFNKTILEKMIYLLSFNAAVSSPSSILAINEDIFQDKKKNSSSTTSNITLRSSLETSILGWKELFNTWRLLQLNSVNQRCKEEFKEATKEGVMANLTEDHSIHINVIQLIEIFAKKADLNVIKKAIANRIQRSAARSYSLSVMNDLMQSLNSTSLKISILSILPNIRRMQDSQLKGHILCNLYSAGSHHESQVKKQFFALYNNLVHLCRDPTVHSQLRAIIIDALCLGFTSYDHEFLLLVFPSLHRIYTISDQEDSWSLALKKHSKLAFQYLSLQCLNVTLTSNSLDPLQKYVLELIITDIEKTAEILKQKRNVKDIDNKSFKSFEFHEGLLFDLMTLLHSLLFHPVIQSHLSTVKLVLSLLQIQANLLYSSRISRLALRMLRNILILMNPNSFNDINVPVSEFVSLSNGSDIISYLFDSIGKSLYLDNEATSNSENTSEDVNKNKFSINYNNGQSIINITSERIVLIRKLMSIARWNAIITQHLNNSLKSLPLHLNLVSSSSSYSSSKSEYYSIIASISILGGFIDSGLRIGGRVSVKSSKENALLVYYDRLSCKAKIILDSNPKKILDCDPDKIVPIEEYPFQVELYPISQDLIDSFNIISSAPILENVSKRAEEEVVFNKEQQQRKKTAKDIEKSESDTVEAEWSCPICTFINSTKSNTCQICGSKKPNVLSTSSEMSVESTSSILKDAIWYCSACTLENDSSSTICAICATPKLTDNKETPKPTNAMSTESISSLKDLEMKDATNEEEEEDEEDEEAEHNEGKYKDILFYRIRSLLINSLACFLKESKSAIKMISSGSLSSLINVSVLPLDTEDAKSLEQYDYKLNRIWELLLQRRFNIKEDTDTMNVNSQSKSLSDVLSYSPFKSLGILLPSNLDRASAKQIRFPSSDLVTVHKNTSGLTSNDDNIPNYALVRSNIVIPNSLPEYYFEIKIENRSNFIKKESESVPIAIGIYREGFELEGIPGNSNSYAYEGFTGHLCHNVGSMRTSRVVEREYGPSFSYGDIIGCGWNIRSQSIYFTKNGESLGDAFDQVNGRFYPCIWSLDSNAIINVNFGQLPFKFDFLNKLPKDYLQSLSSEVVSTKGLSTIEIRRRTLAEELMVMMDIFPKELCILALERCKDDMQIAANWLLENGFKELERMANETISKSLREGKEKQEKEILQAILEEQKALGQFIDAPNNNNISNNTPSSNIVNDDEIESDDDDEDQDDEQNREPARYLEEELDVQVPIQIQNQSANSNASSSSIVEDLKIDNIILGMQLSIINKDSVYYGRTGIVVSIDVNTMNIQLKLFNIETGCISIEWISIQYLQRPNRIYQDYCRSIKDNNNKLIASLAEIECNLTILKIRNSILNLLLIWPNFPFEDIYYKNPQNIVNLLKLTAAQYLLGNSSTSLLKVKNQPILKEFHSRISNLIQLETDTNKEEELPTSVLTKECILHFKNALERSTSNITLESTHPYDNNTDNRFIVNIKGTSKLLIRFDAQCSLHKTDPLTRLSFYRDEEYQDCIATYRGVFNQSNASQSLIIDSDKVFVRFTSGAGETYWGYKFSVTPIDLKLSDTQALNSLNFELGYWILELLIEFAPKLVKNNYINDLYDSIVLYLRHAKKLAKSRGVHLLLRILHEIQHSSNIQVDLSQILKLKPALERKYLEESQDNKIIYSSYLQSLFELVITAQLTQTISSTSTSTSSLTTPNEIPLSECTKYSLIITNCKLTLSNGNSKLCTEELQSIVNNYYDASFLNISFKDLLSILKVTEKAKKITLDYKFANSYLSSISSPVINVEFNTGEHITIKSPYHWYHSNIDIIETVKYYIKHSKFPKSMIEKSYYSERLKNEGCKLITETAESTSPPRSCYYSTIHFSVFTLSMWIKIGEFPTQSSTLVTKYSCNDLSLNEITVILDAEKKIQVHLSSNKDNIDAITSTSEMPENDWFYLNASFDGKKLALSINGTLIVEKNIKSKFLASPGPIYILKHTTSSLNASQQTGDVKVSEVRLFYRNLSEKETLALSKPQFQHKDIMITQDEVIHTIHSQDKFNHLVDESLLEFVYSTICEDNNIDIYNLDSSLVNINDNTFAKYPILRNYSLESIQLRFSVLQLLNFELIRILPLVDFSQNGSKWTLANSITKLKGIMFLNTKYQLFQKILSSTQSNKSRPHVTISRPRALKAKEKGDPEGKHSVFGQLYRQLHFISPVSLRRSGQVWSVNYAGEGGQDAGGLFRDSISHVCSDLQSNYVPLFLKCPNAKGFGDNQDKFIPNPSANSSLQLSMFSFIGKLMGIAIRGKHVLNLDLPSIVWKQIVSSKINRNDLESIDTFSYKIWDQIKNIEDQEGITVDNFTDFIDLTFTTNSSDGREIHLIPNGNTIQVTWENRLHYLDLLEQYRLNEFIIQVDAIKSGLSSIVPVQLLSLFTWQELELSVCGKRDVNIDLLKLNTRYSGYSKTDPVIDMFWKAVEGFSTKEKELLLRFAWGRSRLPLSSEDFEQKFVIMSSPDSTDDSLPVSHTCFFQIELPNYSNINTLKQKVLYAITECREIDADHAAQNVDWDNEEEE